MDLISALSQLLQLGATGIYLAFVLVLYRDLRQAREAHISDVRQIYRDNLANLHLRVSLIEDRLNLPNQNFESISSATVERIGQPTEFPPV